MFMYYAKRHVTIVLLVCLMVVTAIYMDSSIDAKPKPKPDKDQINEVADAGFFDEVKKLLRPDKFLEDLLKRIGIIDKTIADLELERDIHKAHAVSCRDSAKMWEDAQQEALDSYTTAYNEHSAATTALANARQAIQQAILDIGNANYWLEYYAWWNQFYSGTEYADEIAYWLAKKRAAINSKATAEAEIPQQQAIIEAAIAQMEASWNRIIQCKAMIEHFKARETFHRGKVTELQGEIDTLNAEKTEKETNRKNIMDRYDKGN